MRLQDYDFIAKYIPGQKNVFADYLSRDALKTTLPLKDTRKTHINTENILLVYTKYMIQNTLQTTDIIYSPNTTSNTQLPPYYILKQSSPPSPTLCPIDFDPVDDISSDSDDDDDVTHTQPIQIRSKSKSKSKYNYYSDHLYAPPKILIPPKQHNTWQRAKQRQSALREVALNKPLKPISDNFDDVDIDGEIDGNPTFQHNQSIIIRV